MIIGLNTLECQWATMYENLVGLEMFCYDPRAPKHEFDARTGFHPEGYVMFGPAWIFLNIVEPIPNNRDY